MVWASVNDNSVSVFVTVHTCDFTVCKSKVQLQHLKVHFFPDNYFLCIFWVLNEVWFQKLHLCCVQDIKVSSSMTANALFEATNWNVESIFDVFIFCIQINAPGSCKLMSCFSVTCFVYTREESFLLFSSVYICSHSQHISLFTYDKVHQKPVQLFTSHFPSDSERNAD